jgi:excisionase family DNA binding protein
MSAMSDLLTVQQAAARCGVAERTVRRWIASGRLKSDRGPRGRRVALSDLDSLTGQSGPHDGQVRTVLDTSPDAVSDSPVVPDAMSAVSDALRLIEKLQEENRNLAGQVGYYQAQNQQLQHALEAPKVAQDTAPEEEGASASPTGLWGRFLSWLYASG